MFQDQHGLPRQFYKEQCTEGEEEAERGRVGKVASLIGMAWSFVVTP